jgi:hypothetical protein
MRTFLIIFVTIVVIGGAFALYLAFQDPVAKNPKKSLAMGTRAQRAAATTQSVHGIGSVDSPWIRRFENGELASQFRSERSEPKGGDVVIVTRPQAEFFTSDGGQRLRVEGVSGEVIVPGGGGGGGGGGAQGGGAAARTPGAGGGNMTPPSRGRLENVEISMYEPADAAEPTLVATMPNAAFDNDTFRISTEAYTDANGKRVEADQVPVIVRGRDYDFTGRGLVIRWNQLDRKLQLLEVTHGESLTVKNLDALSNTKLTPAAPPAATPATAPTARAASDVMDAMLASADPRAILLASTPAPATAADSSSEKSSATPSPAPAPARRRRPRPAPPPVVPATRPKLTRDLSPVVYRATFDSNVQIFEAGKEVATAERLEIDIMQPPQEDPATKPSVGDGSAEATTRASRRDRRRADATSAPATTTRVTTGPGGVQGPITVKWTGKLRVVPLEGERDALLVPGKALVRLTGAPVKIDHQDMRAQSGVVAFNSADGTASLRANDIVPMVTMSLGGGGGGGGGADVSTPSLTYVQHPDGKRIAMLTGESRAVMTGKGGKDPLTLTWNKEGRIQLIDLADGKSAIEQADFSGAVKVVHPDLEMTGQTLSLAFDPSEAIKSAATQPAGATATSPAVNEDAADLLRQIIATGDVNCRMRDADGAGEDRNIAAQMLTVRLDRTPTGERYARLIDAKGGVRTNAGKDEMQAGELTAELAPPPPATKPVATVDASDTKHAGALGAMGGKSQLISLVAKDAVTLKTEDGSSAAADTLAVKTVNGHEQYRLEGNPATVTQGKTVISGPAILFAPHEQIAKIEGVGGMKGTLPDDAKESFDIAWAGGAVVNGATNLIEVTKKVVIQSEQEDGTINTATSGKLEARLEPKPATQPANATTTAVAATKPSQADKMNFLAGKEVTSATLTAEEGGRVEIKSELFDAAGGLLRGLNLYASTVTTDRSTGRLEVPVPGEMLVRDHRPPEQKKPDAPAADAAGAAKEGPTLGSGRGNTAFKWNKSLTYDDAGQKAVMTGDVQVVHHPITKEGQPFNLWADQLTAEMEPDPTAAKAAAATKAADVPNPQAAKPADDKTAKVRLKRVLASGKVKLESERLNVEDATHLSYDPIAQVLHARGGENTPMTIFDKQNGTPSTVGELEWNTATDQFRIKDLSGKVRP